MKKLIILTLLVPGFAFAQSASYAELQVNLAQVFSKEAREISTETLGDILEKYQRDLNDRYMSIVDRTKTVVLKIGTENIHVEGIQETLRAIEEETKPGSMPALGLTQVVDMKEQLSERRNTLLELTMALRATLAQL